MWGFAAFPNNVVVSLSRASPSHVHQNLPSHDFSKAYFINYSPYFALITFYFLNILLHKYSTLSLIAKQKHLSSYHFSSLCSKPPCKSCSYLLAILSHYPLMLLPILIRYFFHTAHLKLSFQNPAVSSLSSCHLTQLMWFSGHPLYRHSSGHWRYEY